MNKEYFLVAFRKTIGKQDYKIIDRAVRQKLKEAEQTFKIRNNTTKLLEKHDLYICEVKKYWQ